MKLALDNQLGHSVIKALKVSGHEVVFTAGDFPDHIWFKKAVIAGAELFFSPDYDIENMALNNGISFIRIPQRIGKNELSDYVVQAANSAKKIKELYSRFPGMIIVRK